ncbi:MAG: signal peptide peptidase SppA [Candidatus Krumholzibacteriia bacterium]
MKKFWIVFAVVAVVIGGGMFMMWRAVSGLEQTVTIDGGVLVWKVAGDYPEERDDSFWGQVRSGAEPTCRDVLFALRRAAEDDRITGLVLDLQGLETDWAKIEEMQGAVADFRAAGKPVCAYLDAGMTRDYALACGADLVVMSPEASLMVLGVVAQLDFMKDTLGKLGMEADFVHVGRYKSAPERMTRSEASDANREMINAIVEDRYQALVDMIASARGVAPEVAAAWIDQGMYDAPAAVAAGLADTMMYWDELLDARFPDDPVTYLSDYTLDRSRSRGGLPKVALIDVSGVIMPGTSRFDNFQGKIAGSETIIEDLQSALDDEEIRAVILRVDSPGGSAMASDLIWEQIEQVKLEKPVFVSMSGLAASGGYYVSCGADSIFADPGTLTGSIGVYAGKLSRTGMYEKIGVNREFITRGRNALLFSDEGRFTDDQRELFQAQMDGFYERFLGKVAAGRGMTRDQVHAVAQGRVWTGRQGLECGLVDDLGGVDRAILAVKSRLGLGPADKVSLITYGVELTWLERMLLDSLREGGGLASLRSVFEPGPGILESVTGPLPPALLDDLRQDGTLAALDLLDGRPVAMMPMVIRLR